MSKHSARGPQWDRQRQRVLDRDGWSCTYCHKPLDGKDATVDHIAAIAHSDGETYLDHELTSSCRSCNSRKQDKPLVRIQYHNPKWF